ncbi:hypothetical protein ACIHAX_29360 [Nocardia sp. NPDC051929]|uniref:hypothetical protein n=1 Tax=unclassified Nocardia TaxID=2637762 RepID=UPI00341B2EFC
MVEQTASDRVAKKLAGVYNRTGQFVTVGAVVELARERGVPVDVVWPNGAARD